MPNTEPAEPPVLLDIGVAGILGRLADACPELADVFEQHLHEIALSPDLAAQLVGRSARSIREAVARGHLAALGRTKHWIMADDLVAWAGRTITAPDVLALLEWAARRRPPAHLDWVADAEYSGVLPGRAGFNAAVDAIRAVVEARERAAAQ